MSVARVVSSGLRGFECAYRGYVEEPFALGQLVAVREGPFTTVAVIADVASGPEDPTRPLAARGEPGQTAHEYMAANPEVRLLLATRLVAITCGYLEGEVARATLPPIPPPLLGQLEAATRDEVARVTDDGSFLAPLLAAPGCDDAVIAAAIRGARDAFGPGGHEFTVRAGKELARLLKAEPSRMTTILRAVTS